MCTTVVVAVVGVVVVVVGVVVAEIKAEQQHEMKRLQQ